MVKNKQCQYRPCHIGIDEKDFACDLCFCPAYPCGDKTLGKWLNTFVWDCTNCVLPHTPSS